MSETLLHGIERWGKTKCVILDVYKNSHGSVPVVWNFMANRFANVQSYYHLQDDLLWKLAYKPEIPSAFRNVMLMTYDRAVLLQDDVPQAISDIQTFLNEFPLPSCTINHWAQIAEDLNTHHQSKKFIGFGFCMTTIGDTFFEGEEYKKRHLYLNKKIQWKEDGFFNVYSNR
jgi:hypothetical protein